MDKEEVVRIYISHQQEGNLAICNYVDGTRGYYVKWNKSEKDKYHMISLTCGIQETKKMNIGEGKEK